MTLADRYAALRWRVAQYLEGRWWRYYLKGKPPDVYLREKSAYWERTLDRLGWEVRQGRRVLDAGCGPAGVFIYLHERERVTALDPLLGNYEANLPIFSTRNYPAVTFLRQPLEQPLGNQAPFDAIYCFNAINHVAGWESSFDRLTECARPGTKMIMTSDVHRHGILLRIFRLLPGDALHPQQHGPGAYRAALHRRGWVIDREEELRREGIFSYRAWVCTYRPKQW